MSDAAAWDFGRPLHGYAWPAERPRGLVLLQHGYAEHAGRYVDHHGGLVQTLVGLGLSVYAFDMAGHGLSRGRRGLGDLRRTVEDHRAARLVLAERGLPLFLFGHSLGGLVTAASVAHDESGVAGVVLSSPALLLDTAWPARMLLGGLARIAPALPLLSPRSADDLSRRAEQVAAFLDDPLVYRGKLRAGLAASAVDVARRGWRDYGGWRVPTLVVHGTDDLYTDPRGSSRFVEQIGSIDKTLMLVPDGRHELLNDSDAEEVMATIVDWLSRLCVRRPRPNDPEARPDDSIATNRNGIEK